jgi:hypothetical protein
VPEGTTVVLSAKRRVGGPASTFTGTIQPADCDAAGACNVTVPANLAAGDYFLEARATFTP